LIERIVSDLEPALEKFNRETVQLIAATIGEAAERAGVGSDPEQKLS
jgi:hypothetical protein